ncbi:MAG: phospholipase [Gammaproteobacteria bacterium]|nr:phospholipase [Gammaproteobacteria bacterium]
MAQEESFEDVLLSVIEPLLEGLRVFERSSRYLGPATTDSICSELLKTRQNLRAASAYLREADWLPEAQPIRDLVSEAYRVALRGLESLDEVGKGANDMLSLYRTLGARARVCEAIYPLATHFSLVHRYFLDSRKQDIPRSKVSVVDNVEGLRGIHQVENDRKQRGGFSLYIPESYEAERAYPVVFALHGGSGHGSTYLWSWLRTVRTEELVLVSPTSVGGTWAIMGPDQDSPNLHRILDSVRGIVNIDDTRLLLTGMSDGGTFTYVSGCTDDSPFTHLAPCSASFHPMLIEMMSKDRLRDLPICITHGALDWMFTVDIAQTAEYAFSAAGANVFYREISDLAHTYPEDANPELVDWFLAGDL